MEYQETRTPDLKEQVALNQQGYPDALQAPPAVRKQPPLLPGPSSCLFNRNKGYPQVGSIPVVRSPYFFMIS